MLLLLRSSSGWLPAGRLAVFPAAVLLGMLAAGCGLFSSDEASLPGVYESNAFRVERADGSVDDVGEDGAELTMTLTDDGRVAEGRLVVPTDSTDLERSFSGTYTRDGDRVTFDFEGGALAEDYFRTGTPLGAVEWVFYDQNSALLGADADAYVLFLEREGDVPDALAGE